MTKSPLAQAAVLRVGHVLPRRRGTLFAVGLTGEAATLFGLNTGAGIYFTTDGKGGVYMSGGVSAGAIYGTSVGVQVTVMRSYDDFIGVATTSTLERALGHTASPARKCSTRPEISLARVSESHTGYRPQGS